MFNVSTYINKTKKKPWIRRVTETTPHGASVGFRVMTQEDFLNEVNAAAHPINSPMMSRRPIYGPSGEKDKNGKEKWVITGYDDVEVVPSAKQESIINKKIAHFSGDGFWISNETKDEGRFAKLMSHADSAGLMVAFRAAIRAAFRTGDSAIYLYQTDNDDYPIEYEVYDYEHGSTLFPRTDFNGKKVMARQYKYDGHNAVDIWTAERIETWMQIDEDDESIVPKKGREMSEDGYTLVRRKPNQVGTGMCQCIYFRVDDIPSGPGQVLIEKLEDGRSYLGEHLKGSAFPILFMKAEKTTSLPPSELANKAIGVKGTADSIAKADAKWLSPPDASNIASLHLDGISDDIKDVCMSVTIDPEIIKQGSDSSATMQILYDPEIQWAMNAWPQVFKSVRDLASVFKALVGKVENDVPGFSNLRISVGQNIYTPRNKSEALQMELDQLYAGSKSVHAVMADAGNTHIDDYATILQEKEEKLALEAKYNNKTTSSSSTETNPNLPGVTNQAEGSPEGF